MTTHFLANSKVKLASLVALATCAAVLPLHSAWAQNFPITNTQRATANQVAAKGVPLSELAPNAPDVYVIKRGDTLWSISRMYLKSPWRWPELWGMNLNEIKNPHLIYPGQKLILEKANGVASLRVDSSSLNQEVSASGITKLEPRTRISPNSDNGLPTLNPKVIDAFLADAMVVDEATLKNAPRIVATQEGRINIAQGDRAYVRSSDGNPIQDDPNAVRRFRIFREAVALKDPVTTEILGYEAHYLGKSALVHGESTSVGGEGAMAAAVPATIDIISVKEEVGTGDRLLAEPPQQVHTYVPHVAAQPTDGRIVSVYGSAVANAAQNQVVTINRGSRDGMEAGVVLAILKDGRQMEDKSDENRTLIKLPDERNGLLMVFRTFDRVSYALILEVTDAVHIGDHVINPR